MNQGQPQFDQRQQIQQPMQQRFLQDQPQFNTGQQNGGLQGVLAQQQSMHNTPNFFDRPSSSSSATHSQPFSQQSPQGQQFSQQNAQFQMMPPPPPRPPSSAQEHRIHKYPNTLGLRRSLRRPHLLWAVLVTLGCNGRRVGPEHPADLIFLVNRASLLTHRNLRRRSSRRFLTSRSHRFIPLPMGLLRSFTSSSNFSRNSSSNNNHRNPSSRRCRPLRVSATFRALRFLVHLVENDVLRGKAAWMLNRLSLVAWLAQG
jgi:hypothetical protein